MTGESGFLHLNQNGEWQGYDDANPALEMEPDGTLRLAQANGAYVERAALRLGPFEVYEDPTDWYRLQLFGEPLPTGTHVQLFTRTTYSKTSEPTFDPATAASADWHAALRDELDILLPNPPDRYLWVGVLLRSEGEGTPVVRQMRVDYGRDTYLRHLPAIYGEDPDRRDLLERFLSLHGSVLGGLEGAIEDLPRLFDPQTAPSADYPSWLAWLAGWLDFDLNENWADGETRAYLAEAFELYGLRGTVEGLRRYLKLYAGVEAHIQEPGQATTLWTLGENSTLGFTTMLAPAQPQGAVLDSSATLDRSHLTSGDDFGAALFEDVAHRFCVQVYGSDLQRPGALEEVRAVIEREKPAHTTYDLCVIEPRMRVGVQARVGIDAIVAQGPPPAHVGMVLDTGALAEAPVRPTMRVGFQARTGIDTVVARADADSVQGKDLDSEKEVG